jgi:hypothetical protein
MRRLQALVALAAAISALGFFAADQLAAQQANRAGDRNRRAISPASPRPTFPTVPGPGPVIVVPSGPVGGGPNPMQAPLPGTIGRAGSGGGSTGMSKGRFETEPVAPGRN